MFYQNENYFLQKQTNNPLSLQKRKISDNPSSKLNDSEKINSFLKNHSLSPNKITIQNSISEISYNSSLIELNLDNANKIMEIDKINKSQLKTKNSESKSLSLKLKSNSHQVSPSLFSAKVTDEDKNNSPVLKEDGLHLKINLKKNEIVDTTKKNQENVFRGSNLHLNLKNNSETDSKLEFNHLLKRDFFSQVTTNPQFSMTEDKMKEFLLSPVPQGLIFQCNVQRKNKGIDKLYPEYYLSVNQTDIFLMAAKKRPCNTTSNFLITMNKEEFKKEAESSIAKLRSNFKGTEYYLYDLGKNPNQAKSMEETRKQYAAINYNYNDEGKLNRKTKVYIPEIDSTENYKIFKQTNEKEGLIEIGNSKNSSGIEVFSNKPLIWNENTKNYESLFEGRVNLPSSKNIQLIHSSGSVKTYLKFGKLEDYLFSLDFQYPFSPLQAFGIALSSLDS